MSLYLNTALNEGLGTCWARDGIIHHQIDEQCRLCGAERCDDPEYTKEYRDGVWYLNLGTICRYNAISSEIAITFKNPICLFQNLAVMHLGNPSMDDCDRYLLFDRIHVHRVLAEFVIGRNSIRVEPCGAKLGDISSFRARWNSTPSTGGSPLFHRWLLGVRSDTAKAVEHLNDIPLDCREVNLRRAHNLASNNLATHQLARAFRQSHEEFHAQAKKMRADRCEYSRVIEQCPLLPDCVFVRKSFARDKPASSV